MDALVYLERHMGSLRRAATHTEAAHLITAIAERISYVWTKAFNLANTGAKRAPKWNSK